MDAFWFLLGLGIFTFLFITAFALYFYIIDKSDSKNKSK